MKWNKSGFRPPLCTYRLNWARKTWGWWDDTVLQTRNSKFEPWRSEAEHATSRSRRLPTILTFTRGWGRNIFVSFKPPGPGTEPPTLAWRAAVLTTTLGHPPNIVGSLPDRKVACSASAKARISNSVSGGQCHLAHLTILRRLSWPSLAYMCTKVAWIPIHFLSFRLWVAIYQYLSLIHVSIYLANQIQIWLEKWKELHSSLVILNKIFPESYFLWVRNWRVSEILTVVFALYI